MKNLPLTAIVAQLLILAYALQQHWDPFLLFFVFTSSLIIAAVFGVINAVRFSGLNQLPLALFAGLIVSAMTGGLIFAAVNILRPFGIENVAENFTAILATSISLTWFALVLNALSLLVAAARERNENDIDPFFFALKPLIHIIPLFFVVIIGGFIALIGFPQAILIGMTFAHVAVDVLLHRSQQKVAQ